MPLVITSRYSPASRPWWWLLLLGCLHHQASLPVEWEVSLLWMAGHEWHVQIVPWHWTSCIHWLPLFLHLCYCTQPVWPSDWTGCHCQAPELTESAAAVMLEGLHCCPQAWGLRSPTVWRKLVSCYSRLIPLPTIVFSLFPPRQIFIRRRWIWDRLILGMRVSGIWDWREPAGFLGLLLS